jgi:hypothetical protein
MRGIRITRNSVEKLIEQLLRKSDPPVGSNRSEYMEPDCPCNADEKPPIREIFRHVFIINLDRRFDRWQHCQRWFLSDSWPLNRPVRYSAYDGNEYQPPSWYKAGGGAWGCRLSHLSLLAHAVDFDLFPLLVLEDDAEPVDDLAERLQSFMSIVPCSWELLWLGGQHLASPRRLVDGVVIPRKPHRTHAYAVRDRQSAKRLYRVFSDCNGHIDHCGGAGIPGYFEIYCPDPFLFAQREGLSDIDGKNHEKRNWSLTT